MRIIRSLWFLLFASEEVERADDTVGHPADQEGEIHPADEDADLLLAFAGQLTDGLGSGFGILLK